MEKKMQIIAHRGASKAAQENTLEAFSKAIGMGTDAIELDVRKTRDGVLAVFHNPRMARKSIAKITFAELNYIANTNNFSVPTLEQALKLVAGKTQVYIEMKAQGFEEQTAQTAKGILNPEEFKIISFYPESLKIIKHRYPDIQVGMHLGMNLKGLKGFMQTLLRQKKILESVDFFLPYFLFWLIKLTNIIPKKYPLIVWTVDRRGFIKELLKDKRVYGIITNVPEVALKLIDKKLK